jgi:hypothetical protein
LGKERNGKTKRKIVGQGAIAALFHAAADARKRAKAEFSPDLLSYILRRTKKGTKLTRASAF